MQTAKEVFDRSRIFLNDIGAAYFDDTVLLPALKIAYDDLRGELLDNNIPISNAVSATLVITTGMTDVGGTTGPNLPIALMEIQQIFERTQGSSEDWIPMTRMEFLPFYNTLFQQLIYWAWQEQIIKFNGAQTDREIRIEYLKDIVGTILNANSPIDMIRAIPFLSYRTAAIASGFQGEDVERANSLNNNATRELDKLMNLSVKGRQVIPVRRRPFMAGYRRGGGSMAT